ncbi:hypothetical protein A9C19_18255 [Bacillus weihaiensis]|uniref:Uncharacterized protein n=1 Tax=Bacillus weihaiensis TaxID=1547283 RepID=A0A1L3MVZ3_9BACI|nr:hypothetical protein A9C19_18255 [Bacillus weihaiensis]
MLLGSENIMVVNAIVVIVVVKHLLIQLIMFFIVLEKVTTIFYTLKKGNVALLTENLVSVAENPSIEASAANRYVFLLQETELKQTVSKVACMIGS